MRVIRFFIRSAGALLLGVALALYLTNLATTELALARDPIFQISLRWIFWLVGTVALGLAFFCLFGNHARSQLVFVGWLATNFVFYQLGLLWVGSQGVSVIYGKLPETFGVSVGLLTVAAAGLVGYLFFGSYALLLWGWLGGKAANLAMDEGTPVKMVCPSCGGHIAYVAESEGKLVPCPHCTTSIALRKPAYLKMSCYFCKGHIEFPSHAIGRKMKCPHCRKDISLKEPASVGNRDSPP